MTPERWQRVKEVFEAVLERDSSQRAVFLDEACDGDVALRREVESLIESYEKEKSFMSLPVMAAAAQSLLIEQAESLVGQMVGHYKILVPIGAGGMGEVYLAQDTRLGRQVALKLLPTYLSGDSDRLRRFEQEARAASSLNHPNVCMIHEVGEMEDGRHYIVMEHIEGVTLRQQMATHSLKLSQALYVATQVAAALAAAHGAGIVHRDIKPENVMVRNDGLIKVLDFGLAKRITLPVVVDDGAATKLLGHTEPGMVMGTVAYMSPEQARGLEIDARTDIWSLGVVLYEMVAGNVPFAGATSSDLIVSILDREPLPLDRHLPDVPAELQRIVSKALRKDKEERYQVVKDLFLDLKSLKQELEFSARLQHSTLPESSGQIGRREVTGDIAHEAAQNVGQQTKEVQKARTTLSAEFLNRKPLFWTAGILGGLSLLVGAWYVSRLIIKSEPAPPALIAVPLTTDPGYEGMPSLSPDGSQVAFGSFGEKLDNLDIYVKQIGGGPPLRLTSDPAVDKYPAWSPDGRLIAFIRERGEKQEVLLIPALGGPERKLGQIAPALAELYFVPPYLSWSADSKYLVTVDRASSEEPPGLFVLSVASGERRRLTRPPAPALSDTNPAVSPDGRTLAFVRLISAGNAQLYVLPLSDDCQPNGEARRIDLSQPWVGSPAWTEDGREIVCNAGPPWVSDMLWRVPVSDAERPVFLASLGKTSLHPTLSRQGDRLVYAVYTGESTDIWRAEVSGRKRPSTVEKLIASTRGELNPQYSPDGSRVTFSSDRSGKFEIWACNGDGSNPVQLTSLDASSGTPRWFPDGRRIVFDSQKEGQADIYVIDADTRVPRRLTSDPSDEAVPSVSHDGKWIYFSSTRTGRWEIWRQPAEGGEALQMTHEGGFLPLESHDGKSLYYQKKVGDESEVWKVPVVGGEESKVLGPVGDFQFAVVVDGIYFIEPGPPGYAGWTKGNSLRFYSFTTGNAEKVFDIKYRPEIGLTVSPDGRYVLFSQRDPFGLDLMLVENFR